MLIAGATLTVLSGGSARVAAGVDKSKQADAKPGFSFAVYGDSRSMMYLQDLDIVVFNGHLHTTELYDVDGVKYLVLGGGGAEQDPILPGRTHVKVPAGYPPDKYWGAETTREDYNYVLVDVQPGQKTKFTLNRFGPQSAEPFGSVELFGASR